MIIDSTVAIAPSLVASNSTEMVPLSKEPKQQKQTATSQFHGNYVHPSVGTKDSVERSSSSHSKKVKITGSSRSSANRNNDDGPMSNSNTSSGNAVNTITTTSSSSNRASTTSSSDKNDSEPKRRKENNPTSFVPSPLSLSLQNKSKDSKSTQYYKKRKWDDSVGTTSSGTIRSSNSYYKDEDDSKYNYYGRGGGKVKEEDFMALPSSISKGKCSTLPSQPKLKENVNKKLIVATKSKKKNVSGGIDTSKEALTKRANRFLAHASSASVQGEKEKIIPSSATDHDRYMGKSLIGGSSYELDETHYEQMTVKGTSTTLEKDYLRLTAPPKPESVRPFAILRQHLQHLKQEYYYLGKRSSVPLSDQSPLLLSLLKERERTPQTKWKLNVTKQNQHRRRDYLWFCSQLKAVRQDCTVQRIQGSFAVDVYETHARIALQEGDLNEYNQCQTQLKELYKSDPPVSSAVDEDSNGGRNNDAVGNHATGTASTVTNDSPTTSKWENEDEFIAYRLLYYVCLSTNEKYLGGSSDMFHIMLTLTSKQKDHPAIRHALQVREAISFNDYSRFFGSLLHTSPNLGFFLTNRLVPTMRMRGLRCIAKAYRPSIEANVCLRQLGLVNGNDDETNKLVGDNKDGDAEKACSRRQRQRQEQGSKWLIDCGAVITADGDFITKDSTIHEPVTTGSNKQAKNSLI